MARIMLKTEEREKIKGLLLQVWEEALTLYAQHRDGNLPETRRLYLGTGMRLLKNAKERARAGEDPYFNWIAGKVIREIEKIIDDKG